ncbi:MAG: rhomboid family intramembrane serine protease [Lachnospiraceae bacterium]|nr:rhomboid family intramembrane serine protease [Lachnospiraceae bacterium]
MINKLSGFFTHKGYLKLNVRDKEIEVVFKVVPGGLMIVCFLDDSQDWLKVGVLDQITQTVSRILTEKYPQFPDAKTHAIIVTNEPTRTRQKCENCTSSFWMIHEPTRRLMIFEDQVAEFGDARTAVEECLKQNVVSLMLTQLKELFSPVNITLIFVNIFIMIVLEIMGDTNDASFMHSAGAFSVADLMWGKHDYWRLFTCAFLHFGWQHLLYNMISLLYLGKPLEKYLGSVKYAIFYVLCVIGSSAISACWYYFFGGYLRSVGDMDGYLSHLFCVTAGASGAICGVAGGVAYILIKNRKANRNFSFIRWLIFVGLLMFSGVGSEGVNNAAHIGGMIFGFLLCIVFVLFKKKGDKPQFQEVNNG